MKPNHFFKYAGVYGGGLGLLINTTAIVFLQPSWFSYIVEVFCVALTIASFRLARSY